MLRYHDWSTRLRAVRCRFFGATDHGRWADADTFENWEERTKLMAALIPEEARVIEFGAGNRLLERHLHPSCSYVPSDLVSRGPDTIVLDLNTRPLPQLARNGFDVAACAGVLEYLADLPSFAHWLATQARSVVASYECSRSEPRTWARLTENYSRAGAGWVNGYSERELVELFADAGLARKHQVDWHTADGDERIYLFERKTGRAR